MNIVHAKNPLPQEISRRGFLKGGGALIVTFTIGSALPLKSTAVAVVPSTLDKAKSLSINDVEGFLSIDEQGVVTVFSGKVDLGTGVRTALMQIVADELDTSMDRIKMIQGDTLLTPDQGPTFGSLSIQVGGMQIRQAAATARAALRAQGAQKLGVPLDAVKTADGSVLSSGRSLSYGELVGNAPLTMKVDAKAALKDPASYKIVGKSVRRVDIAAKVTGEFTFMHDLRVPGMLHARVIRPAGIKSDLLSYDDSKAKKVNGFVQTVRKGNFLAVVAKSEWAAIKASRLVNAKWSEWKGLPERAKIYEHMRRTQIVSDENLQKAGDASAGLKGASKVMSADYQFAVHTHGSIGPSCSVADYKDGKVTVWSASQMTHNLQKQIAHMLELKNDDVHCIYVDGSGCYGRNGHEDASGDAALISREIGKPVRVQWMRHDEHGWDPKGVPTSVALKAGMDAQGQLVAWSAETWLPIRPKDSFVPLLAAQIAGLPSELDYPGSIQQGLAIPYNVPNVEITSHWIESTPLRASWIRTPGRMQNNFAGESFFDELAHAAGVDPFEARLKYLQDPRGLDLLQRLKAAVNWVPSTPRSKIQEDVARGRGVAYIRYDLARTYVGAVADIEVNVKTGEIKVIKFTVAQDCGQIINPDGVTSQIDGNVIQTISRTLIEDLKWDASNVTSLDWNSYPILRMPAVPKIDYVLIDRPNEKPWGAGEPSAAVIPAAIGNAVFDATGARLREVPFTAERVLAAIKAATQNNSQTA